MSRILSSTKREMSFVGIIRYSGRGYCIRASDGSSGSVLLQRLERLFGGIVKEVYRIGNLAECALSGLSREK